MSWKSVGCMLPFALLWCGGTGTGIFFTARTMLLHLDSQARFVPVEAAIESTEVVRSGRSDRKLRVTFSYEAGGSRRRAVGPTFDHLGAAFAERDPSKYPPGMKTTAWVDPKRPERAVLDRRIPQDTWWSLMFLQPFLAVSIGFVVALLKARSRARRERDFLGKDALRPWTVPDWGVLEERGSVLTIRRAPEAARAALVAWGLSTFASTFAGGMLAAGFDLDVRSVLLPAFAVCALAAAGAAGRSRRRGGRTLTIDRAARELRIADARGERRIPWASVRDLREAPAHVSRRTGPRGARLWLRRKDGTEETLNEFLSCIDDRAVAARIGRHLAEALEAPFESGF
jgi:hypothetical protein